MNKKTLAAVALVGGVAVALSACGSSGAAKAPTNANANQGGVGGGFAGRLPGASGLVAAVDGSTAQVQSASAQTAVSWTSSTTFTDEVKVTKAAVKVGECVQASRAQTSSGSSSGTALAAASVRIVSTSGGCTAVQPRAGSRPSGAPTTFPGGQSGTRPRGTFGNVAAIGVVTSVSSSGFAVKSIAFGGSNGSTAITVTTTSSTAYLQTQKANAAAVKVGVCMSANGTTDSTGAVSATRITLSQPTNGVCTQTRLGGGGFPGGAPGGFPGAAQNG